jgi:hypothetical protein
MQPGRTAAGMGPAPDIRRKRGIRFAALALGLLATAAAVYLLNLSGWLTFAHQAPARPDSPELQLCRQFMDLENAGDPRARDLLEPPPSIPDHAVSPEEADRLDAEVMLHRPLHLRAVRALPAGSSAAPRFALVAEGSLGSEHVLVQTPTGIDSRQRSLWSPDLIVEVHDSKIHGIQARLHED